jgi:hypothetical protein
MAFSTYVYLGKYGILGCLLSGTGYYRINCLEFVGFSVKLERIKKVAHLKGNFFFTIIDSDARNGTCSFYDDSGCCK